MKEIDIKELATDTLETILEKLSINHKLETEIDDETTVVKIFCEDTSDQGALIGYHGATLYSLQNLLKLIIFKKTDNWPNLIVDVGDYRKERVEKLHNLAEKNAEKARFMDTEINLPAMPPIDRREIHLAIANMPGVSSESAGEGDNRYVVIKPEKD